MNTKMTIRDLMDENLNLVATPAQARAILAATAIGVLKGQIPASAANSVALLFAEVHKSIKEENSMKDYTIINGEHYVGNGKS